MAEDKKYSHWANSPNSEFEICKDDNGDILFVIKKDFVKVSFAVNPAELPRIIGVLKKEVKENE